MTCQCGNPLPPSLIKRKRLCETCRREYLKKWREKNREEYNEYHKIDMRKRRGFDSPVYTVSINGVIQIRDRITHRRIA